MATPKSPVTREIDDQIAALKNNPPPGIDPKTVGEPYRDPPKPPSITKELKKAASEPARGVRSIVLGALELAEGVGKTAADIIDTIVDSPLLSFLVKDMILVLFSNAIDGTARAMGAPRSAKVQEESNSKQPKKKPPKRDPRGDQRTSGDDIGPNDGQDPLAEASGGIGIEREQKEGKKLRAYIEEKRALLHKEAEAAGMPLPKIGSKEEEQEKEALGRKVEIGGIDLLMKDIFGEKATDMSKEEEQQNRTQETLELKGPEQPQQKELDTRAERTTENNLDMKPPQHQVSKGKSTSLQEPQQSARKQPHQPATSQHMR